MEVGVELYPEFPAVAGQIVNDTNYLDGLPIITEAELGFQFDELTNLVANQPDDLVACRSLKQLVTRVHEQGNISLAMQMAVTVGAIACTHAHMEGLASDISGLFSIASEPNDDLAHDHESDMHDASSCEDCLAGRRCSKH